MKHALKTLAVFSALFNGNLFNLRKGSRNEESFDRHDF